jgi:hypothetical protein
MFNYGSRFASPMAWNGSNGIYAGQPGYVSFMAWRNTPLEDAMRDFAVSHAFLPLGARLWTFGSPRLADADGWSTSPGALVAAPGHVDLAAVNGELTLVSPSPLALGGDESDLLTLGVTADQVRNIATVAVEGRLADGTTIVLATPRGANELASTSAGLSLPLVRRPASATIDQIRVTLTLRVAGGPAYACGTWRSVHCVSRRPLLSPARRLRQGTSGHNSLRISTKASGTSGSASITSCSCSRSCFRPCCCAVTVRGRRHRASARRSGMSPKSLPPSPSRIRSRFRSPRWG